eukprot:CAMPEP_0118927380 /NCGR_PEP_ID=MMETSP1169-20130426/4867_1 /TAXON_ID=36882 /ORGANISM="Pyramimonas obovata, Strain CCMP722" /LENGTH=92 /DNA_ID=CAMNT_0006869127 /DNA_START=85 /DNA_END=359 /DNA_ORIENTATION=+
MSFLISHMTKHELLSTTGGPNTITAHHYPNNRASRIIGLGSLLEEAAVGADCSAALWLGCLAGSSAAAAAAGEVEVAAAAGEVEVAAAAAAA